MKRVFARRADLVTFAALIIAAVCTLIFFSRISIEPRIPIDRIEITSSSNNLSEMSLSSGVTSGSTSPRYSSKNAGFRDDQSALVQAPYKVTAGIYAVNSYGVDLSVPSYSGKGYIWFKWNKPMQDYVEDSGVSIEDLLVPINLLGSAEDKPILPIGNKPEILDTGEYWQVFTYHGDFFVDHLSFEHFPFNKLTLPIVIEADDPDGSLSFDGLRITADLDQSGLGAYSSINGYNNLGFTMAEYKHHYDTNFGQGGPPSDYSQLVFRAVYGSSVWSSFWTLLQPLAIVMAMVVVVSRIQHDIWDVRIGIPATVLLTLVFLQESYKSSLPKLPYLTFLDEVYVIAYLLTLVAFVLSIWEGKQRASLESLEDSAKKDAISLQIEQFDRIWPPSVIVVGFVAVVLCWFI